jgi:tRNA(Ile)-lysidine synthase
MRRSPCAPATNGATVAAAERDDALIHDFAAAMAALGLTPGARIALAVSGGGDSMALLHLFRDWVSSPACGGGGAASAGGDTVLIVDHGLRAGSARDATTVRDWARDAGFDAHVLTWKHSGKRQTGLEERARIARYRLLGKECREHGIEHLLVAHTQEDQAETFLLRLARGSGVDGLAAMRAQAPLPVPGFASVTLCRPLLGMARGDLRAYVTRRGGVWLEDPMNADPRFARVQMRRLLPALAEAGITPGRMAKAAAHLARARGALEAATGAFLAAHARFRADGTALFDAAALARVPAEIGLRALAAMLGRVSGAQYRPRFHRLESLFAAVSAPAFPGRTLSGCRIAKAPRARAEFGPATLEIQPETPRRMTAAVAAKARKARPKAGKMRKMPYKGRNIMPIWNS